jgi:DNA-binding MarR family transcriptional regulator
LKTNREKNRENSPGLPALNTELDYNNSFDIWVLLDRTHFAVARSRLLELAQYHLTKEQAQILHEILLFGGSASMTQIASFTMRQHHSVSTLVNRMVKAGLVKKIKAPNNRGFKVTITKKGHDRYQQVTRKSIEMIFSSLSTADKRKLAVSLNQVQNKARALLGLDRSPPFLDRTTRD